LTTLSAGARLTPIQKRRPTVPGPGPFADFTDRLSRALRAFYITLALLFFGFIGVFSLTAMVTGIQEYMEASLESWFCLVYCSIMAIFLIVYSSKKTENMGGLGCDIGLMVMLLAACGISSYLAMTTGSTAANASCFFLWACCVSGCSGKISEWKKFISDCMA
jgi:hypothetical protein